MDANEKIEVQNKERRKNIEESVQKMETNDSNRMEDTVHQAVTTEDQIEERMGTVNCKRKRSQVF